MPKDPNDPGPRFNWHKRAFLLRLLRPFAPERAIELPPNSDSVNRPSTKKIIAFEPDNRTVLALLGPLATGEPAPGGYALERIAVEETRIRVYFARGTTSVIVLLTALAETDLAAHGTTASLRLHVEGDAPEAERIAVADRVLAEVRARDRGQIWQVAGSASFG